MSESLDHHVGELRKRLIYVSVFFTACTAVTLHFSGDILSILQSDLGYSLNALKPYEVFNTQLRIAALTGFLASLPFTLYQVLGFMKPGLKHREYRIVRNYLPFSVLLFALGFLFSYQFIVKTSLGFFSGINSSASITAVWSLKSTLSFALKVSAFTGIIFQLPIISTVLAHAGLIDKEDMIRYRPHFVVSVLFAAAVATPPDIITQLLITAPVIGLYQASILLVSKIKGRTR